MNTTNYYITTIIECLLILIIIIRLILTNKLLKNDLETVNVTIRKKEGVLNK